MKEQTKLEERAALIFCAMQGSQAAQSMPAWHWAREVLARPARPAGIKAAKTKTECRRDCCGAAICPAEAEQEGLA